MLFLSVRAWRLGFHALFVSFSFSLGDKLERGIMRKLIKRIAAVASAVVIGGVSCVTTWFSVPVSAAGAFGMLEWLEFQTLLQGIGVSGNNSDFADSVQDWIDGIGGPEMPREEYDGKWMTNYEYYSRLGWDSIIDWCDGLFSGDNAYSDIADVGADVSGVYYPPGLSSCNGVVRFRSKFLLDNEGVHYPSDSYPYLHIAPFRTYMLDSYMYLVGVSDSSGVVTFYLISYIRSEGGYATVPDPYYWLQVVIDKSTSIESSKYLYSSSDFPSYSSSVTSIFSSLGCKFFPSLSFALSAVSSFAPSDNWADLSSNDDFIGPVYTYLAAQDLYKSTGTAAGIRLDVQTEDGVPDIQAALDGAGVKTVDDLVSGVAAGTVPMSKVFADAKVTPYVVADTATGAVVTDLGVSATAAGVKAVGLTQELAVPKDLTTAATYPIKGKTWDPDMSKYNLPLFQYFPFCLPWDIYQVLSAFAADPVAPSITIPIGKFFSGKKSFDGSAAAGITATVDLGDDKFSKWFVMLRALESAGIVIGLVLISVKLIHGGR